MAKEAKQETAIAPIKHMGDRSEILAVRGRLLSMMPGAAAFPDPVLWAAAQLAVAYRLDPFNGEIYIAKMGVERVGNDWVEKYAPIIGIKGFRALARRQSHYVIEQPVRELDADEVKRYRGEEYDPEDVGVEIRLFRLDIAGQCQRLNIPYYPTVARGFWRKKAKAKKDRQGEIVAYTADSIPETWTRHEVAEKRAEKAAIVKAFDLRVPVETLADESFDFDVEVERMIDDHDRAQAIPAQRDNVIVEEDGDVLYAKQ